MSKVGKTNGRKLYNTLEAIERFEAGVELLGTEVKSIKEGRGVFSGARVLIRGGEVFMIGVSIPVYQPANAPGDYVTDRPRRLLLSKAEINKIVNLEATYGAITVPSRAYVKGNRIKIEVVVGRRKKKFDKRQDIKRKEDTRSVLREIKQTVKLK
ncbi:MAG TPA: SsrA-binding protein [Candidatus Paceibacterota bacterium]